jgi:DNA-binding response OmpR family regulator
MIFVRQAVAESIDSGGARLKVVVVEGRRGPTDQVIAALREGDHQIYRGATRDSAKSMIHAREPQLLVIVALPFLPWHLSLLSDLLTWEHTPYSLAVAETDSDVLAALLRAGADGACSYPLEPGLFEAEVVALGRRAAVPPLEPPIPEVVTVRDLTVDNARYQASFAGSRLNMTPAEFRILASLARRPGKVVPTDTLSVEALGNLEGGQSAKDTLKVHVRRIRNKIREAGGTSDYIWNIRGVGYMLERRAPAPGRHPEDAEADED